MRKLLKNFICKVFNIKQCACPEEDTSENDMSTPKSNVVGHCVEHDTYKYTCLDCNFAIRKK
jgi:hypothetical protein